MIIELPFSYEANYVPPRARNERRVYVSDLLPLNIREVDPARFPVAARFADNSQVVTVGGLDDIHWDGKRFFRPAWDQKGRARRQVPAVGLEDRIQGHDTGPEKESPFRHLQKIYETRYSDKEWHRHADLTGRVISDNRQDRVAELVRCANNVVISGGLLFEACGEPGWHIPATGTVSAHAMLVMPQHLEQMADRLVRADRLEEYRKLFYSPYRLEAFGRIEVLLPQALSLNPEPSHLRKACAGMLSHMGDRLARATREEFGMFADLRDALDDLNARIAAGEASREEVTDDLVAAARAAIDSEGAIAEPGPKKALLAAFERWRLSLIREEPDTTVGIAAPTPR